MLRADDVVRREQTKGCDIRIPRQSRAGPVLPRAAAQHTRHGGHAHGGADHQDRGVQKLRSQRHNPGKQHEGIETLGAEVVQRTEHHLH